MKKLLKRLGYKGDDRLPSIQHWIREKHNISADLLYSTGYVLEVKKDGSYYQIKPDNSNDPIKSLEKSLELVLKYLASNQTFETFFNNVHSNYTITKFM